MLQKSNVTCWNCVRMKFCFERRGICKSFIMKNGRPYDSRDLPDLVYEYYQPDQEAKVNQLSES